MYFPLTIDNKREFIKNGLKIIDLTEQNFEFTDYFSSVFDAFFCPSQFEMRPDLLAEKVYNDSDKSDILLKYNSISNPFSLESGDFILSIDAEKARKSFKKKSRMEELDKKIRNQFIDPSKKNKENKELKKFKNRNLSLPPNISTNGKAPIEINNGKVELGGDISTTENTKETPLSKKRFLEIINQLKKQKYNQRPVKKSTAVEKKKTIVGSDKKKTKIKKSLIKPKNN